MHRWLAAQHVPEERFQLRENPSLGRHSYLHLYDYKKKREGELVGGNIKLQTVRSRLYRSRFLRSNTRWKALDEIFKFHILLANLDIKILQNFVKNF